MPISVLAVDDSSSMRQMVTFALKGAGYVAQEAADGQAALDVAKTQTFDLVVTDQNMPRMDGITLIQNLRKLPAYKNVPILVLTSESSDDFRSRGKAAGATGWLVKPFDPEKLIKAVKLCLSR
jgi:two-component system chemotaxis response regulator CheY